MLEVILLNLLKQLHRIMLYLLELHLSSFNSGGCLIWKETALVFELFRGWLTCTILCFANKSLTRWALDKTAKDLFHKIADFNSSLCHLIILKFKDGILYLQFNHVVYYTFYLWLITLNPWFVSSNGFLGQTFLPLPNYLERLLVEEVLFFLQYFLV